LELPKVTQLVQMNFDWIKKHTLTRFSVGQ